MIVTGERSVPPRKLLPSCNRYPMYSTIEGAYRTVLGLSKSFLGVQVRWDEFHLKCMGIHGPHCETSFQCIQVCSFSCRCGTWICSPSWKNLRTLKASTEDQSEGCQKLLHLGPFSIFLSEGMGMDTPANSVEYKIILMFGLYLPQIDMTSFPKGAFCILDWSVYQ